MTSSYDFIDCISFHPGITQRELSNLLSVSERTIRSYVRQANTLLDDFASIDRARGEGYRLVVTDEERYRAWHDAHYSSRTSNLPDSSEERIRYLLVELVRRSDWVTIDSLSETLFVSRKVLSNDLRRVENILEGYGLSLQRRPHYGICVSGSEMNRRLCLAPYVEKGDLEVCEHDGKGTESLSKLVAKSLSARGVSINPDAKEDLILYVAVSIMRMREGHSVSLTDGSVGVSGDLAIAKAANGLARAVESAYGVEMGAEEVSCLAIHLEGRRDSSDYAGDESVAASLGAGGADCPPDHPGAVLVTRENWRTITELLDAVWDAYRFDFRDDLELRVNLARHIVPLTVRLRYGIGLHNPLLADVRRNYPLAYAMGLDALSVLAKRYGVKAPEDEAGYLALAFELALERLRGKPDKKSILIICASGAGSARLLKYRFENEFSTRLSNVSVCALEGLDSMDYESFDYVFSTVQLDRALPVPTFRIPSLLGEEAVRDIGNVLESHDAPSGPSAYFKRDLFLPHLGIEEKGELLHLMCSLMMAACADLPNGFEELVFRREAHGCTAFGGGVAMPHPITAVGTNTIACVGVLDRPIAWDASSSVRVVVLVSVADSHDGRLRDFYGYVGKLLGNQEAISRLVSDQRYETLVALLE